MLFGLTNAPVTCIDLMNRVFHVYLDKFMIVCIDDLLVYSPGEAEQVEHLKMVLRTLREKKQYVEFSK